MNFIVVMGGSLLVMGIAMSNKKDPEVLVLPLFLLLLIFFCFMQSWALEEALVSLDYMFDILYLYGCRSNAVVLLKLYEESSLIHILN